MLLLRSFYCCRVGSWAELPAVQEVDQKEPMWPWGSRESGEQLCSIRLHSILPIDGCFLSIDARWRP